MLPSNVEARWVEGEYGRYWTGRDWSGTEYGANFSVDVGKLEKAGPYRDDADAAAAAIAWLASAFGLSPASLKCASVKRMSSEGKPSSEGRPLEWWREGHAVVIRQLLDGVPVDMDNVVVLAGRSVKAADVRIYQFTLRDGSRKACIDADEAVNAARSFLVARGLPWSESDSAGKLMYIAVISGPRGGRQRESSDVVFAAAWKFDTPVPLVVDAFTRVVRVND